MTFAVSSTLRFDRLRNLRVVLAVLLLAITSDAAMSAQIKEVGDGGPGPFKAEHLTTELVALAPDIASGGQSTIGLSFTLEEHWHVYWINAGDSGEPPAIQWTLRPGLTAGPLQFDPPSRLPLGPLMDFGYEDQVTFPITLTAASSLKPGKVHLDARVTWLVCAQVCIPGKAHLGIDLNVVAPGSETPALVGALGTAISLLPQSLGPNMSASAIAGKQDIVVDLHTGTPEEDGQLYPFLSDVCTNGSCEPQSVIANAGTQTVETLPDGVRIRVPRDLSVTALPSTFHVLVEVNETEAYEFTVPLKQGEVAGAHKTPAQAQNTIAATGISALGFIGLAFLGGILLNLMPCVFPVLFLKGLALVHSSGETRGRRLKHGLVYTLGILVSFWAVVGVLLVLRASGSSFGWGFQLQSPTFVALLAALIFFLALSLAGQFEIGLSITGAGDELTRKQGLTGSFFTGVLATIVATPCTAPLMGAAIGFALAQTSWLTFTIFTALGFGLALPYLALTAQPGWTNYLPKPGAWMEVLKQLTAVPLFATAIWLAWVYGRLYGNSGVNREARLLLCFLILAVAGWTLGRWPARWVSTITAVLLAVFALSLPLLRVTVERVDWKPWSPSAFQAARASGKPVFVDFTAAWCLSCQVNERLVLDSAPVESKLAAGQFVLLRADWTNYDPALTAALGDVGRSGVPTYAIYPAGQHVNPDVLPEVLSQSIVEKAIDKDIKQEDK